MGAIPPFDMSHSRWKLFFLSGLPENSQFLDMRYAKVVMSHIGITSQAASQEFAEVFVTITADSSHGAEHFLSTPVVHTVRWQRVLSGDVGASNQWCQSCGGWSLLEQPTTASPGSFFQCGFGIRASR